MRYAFLYIYNKERGCPLKINCNNCNCNDVPITIHLKSRKSMKYDILNSMAPKKPTLGIGQRLSFFGSKKPQKTCVNPFFRCFSLYLAHM